jgi:hypothetical protein
MCKTCGLAAYGSGQTMCTNNDFYTVFFKQITALRITTRFNQLFAHLVCTVMNIKISLNQPVGAELSTLSTLPITTATKLKFNEFIII